ncbi:MAG TPA: hypothetical protein VL093_10410 [Flavipsychrobacter sp.]|jgi:hypothetical protein|nr:hypothetical protein [Flavipsychrobacter sp.]
MKKLLLFSIAIASFAASDAQQLSGGFRTGVSHWMDQQKGKCFTNSVDGQSLTWDKEIFVRYQTKGKLAFEASMGQYAFNNIRTDANNYGGYYDVHLKERSQNLEWNLTASYDVTCPEMNACPMMKHLKSYLGVVFTPTLTRYTTELKYREVNDVATYTSAESRRDDFSIWTGLSHTLVYELCDHMYISSALRLQVDPNRIFEKHSGVSSYPDSRVGLQVGFGYNLR